MASVEAAAALITAESLVIAAAAISLRDRAMFGELGRIASILVYASAIALMFSFALSLAYLHAAEFPNGRVAQGNPELAFNVAIFSLLFIVYVGIGFGWRYFSIHISDLSE